MNYYQDLITDKNDIVKNYIEILDEEIKEEIENDEIGISISTIWVSLIFLMLTIILSILININVNKKHNNQIQTIQNQKLINKQLSEKNSKVNNNTNNKIVILLFLIPFIFFLFPLIKHFLSINIFTNNKKKKIKSKIFFKKPTGKIIFN